MPNYTQRYKNEVGNKYGLLMPVRFAGIDPVSNAALFECKCDCGNTVIVSGGSLRSGNRKSCGCLRKLPRKPKADACVVCGKQGKLKAKNMCNACYTKMWNEKRMQEFERYL